MCEKREIQKEKSRVRECQREREGGRGREGEGGREGGRERESCRKWSRTHAEIRRADPVKSLK